ncbi:glycosyltransferase family 2 protein [Shewanella abyssi]|uniref:glycosyltransferase family 2 protein n=1 Tax=Shewanella abyssi TaxID=311789 RepID=UPI0020108203|nr:glycosyltransferase family 2 protein [Shewanella abyssi]MCL1049588.1 glycosyltransferase family 2 protein [Shewanella abyssi]
MQPLVSIIMPAYNSSEFICESIDSVLSQTYMNWELIITDDFSTDGTQNIIENYARKDNRIKFHFQDANLGAGAARNKSIRKSNGRFIAFLDSDDLWLQNKLEVQVKFMVDNDVALSYSGYKKFSRQGVGGIVKPQQTVNYKQLLCSNVIGCLTAMYDSHLMGKRYMPLIRKRQDMGLWLDILKDIDCAKAIPEVLAMYRVDSGMTQNKFHVLKYQWRFYRDVVGLSRVKSLMFFVIYSYKGFIKSQL